MRQALCICRKEFNVYFASPIAYIVIAIFLLVTGWFFFSTFFIFNQASLRNFFRLLPVVFAFVVPAVTMRQFAEELNIGSYELLLTMPLRFPDIVLGKFMASVAFVAALLAPTLAYPVIVAFLGMLDWGPVIGGYIGALLLGAAFSAVGLFASALTCNQIVAFIRGGPMGGQKSAEAIVAAGVPRRRAERISPSRCGAFAGRGRRRDDGWEAGAELGGRGRNRWGTGVGASSGHGR